MASEGYEGRAARLRRLRPALLALVVLVALAILGLPLSAVGGRVYAFWFTFFLAPFSVLYCIPFGLGLGIKAQQLVWYTPEYGHRFVRLGALVVLASMLIGWGKLLFFYFDPLYLLAVVWPVAMAGLMMLVGMYYVRQAEYEQSAAYEDGLADDAYADDAYADEGASAEDAPLEEPREDLMPEPAPVPESAAAPGDGEPLGDTGALPTRAPRHLVDVADRMNARRAND